MFSNVARTIALLLIFCLCLPLASCGEGGESSASASSMAESFEEVWEFSSNEVFSEEISENSAVDFSENTEEISDEISSESIDDESEESVEESIEQSSEEPSEESVEESLEESSTEASEESSDEWQTNEKTYFEETGKCTYTTVYSPKTQDEVSYKNNGIVLYNTDFRMSAELEEEFLTLFESFENPQSITVREMNTEFVFSYNPNTRIACASAIKAPFSLFATKCIEQGLVSWNEKLVYEKKYDYFEGSGVIQQSYDYGTKFSVKRLYELMLYVSDNIAYLMLKDRFGGASKFNDAMNVLGCKDIIDWGNWGKLTSYEMALVWREIYHYIQSGSSESQKLYKELDRALYNELEKGITGKENLHKSGWSSNGYNDAGLFYDGDLVYSVAVMTGRKSLTDYSNSTHLIKVSKLINKLMEEYKIYCDSAQNIE